MNVRIWVHRCTHVCRTGIQSRKRAFSGLGRMMSLWWTFVKVMLMDLCALSNFPAGLLLTDCHCALQP